MHIRETGCEDADLTGLEQDRVQHRAYVNEVMSLPVE
jgi:hypothetical protein